MTKIKGRREINEDVELEVKPIGQPVTIRFLEETLKAVELDSPHPGMTHENIYAKFVYFLGHEFDIPSKENLVRSERRKQGWTRAGKNSTDLCLDFGDSPYGRYRLEYKEREVEVFI